MLDPRVPISEFERIKKVNIETKIGRTNQTNQISADTSPQAPVTTHQIQSLITAEMLLDASNITPPQIDSPSSPSSLPAMQDPYYGLTKIEHYIRLKRLCFERLHWLYKNRFFDSQLFKELIVEMSYSVVEVRLLKVAGIYREAHDN